MNRLTDEFLESCPRQGELRLRGERVTRLDTFVDAAFAFALTMLVISIDEIPRSPAELLDLSRDIPSFVLSAALIGTIWLSHTRWSRVFGLQDRVSLLLSLAVVILIMVFVYPIKLMTQATVIYFSEGLLGPELPPMTWPGVAGLMSYFSIGLLILAALIIALYGNALRWRRELRLDPLEMAYCRRLALLWLIVALTAALSIMIAQFATGDGVVYAGHIYFSLLPSLALAGRLARRRYERGVGRG